MAAAAGLGSSMVRDIAAELERLELQARLVANPGTDWAHETFATGGEQPARVALDFRTSFDPAAGRPNEFASPLWLNVERPDLGANSHVHAIWQTRDQGVGGEFVEEPPVQLEYAGGGRFTLQLPDAELFHEQGTGYRDHQDHRLGLIINDEPRQDQDLHLAETAGVR